MQLGVCYYPEHWSHDWWAQDATAMAAMGIRWVRWGIELTLLLLGLALGGAAGLGTVVFAFGTGPVLAVTLPWAATRLGTHLTQAAAV